MTGLRLNELWKTGDGSVADDKKTLKFQMMMSPKEAEILDNWMFEHRIRSRAEAIRKLCQAAIATEKMVMVNAVFALKASKDLSELSDKLASELPEILGEEKAAPILHFVHEARLAAVNAMRHAGGVMGPYQAFLKQGDVDQVIEKGREQVEEFEAEGHSLEFDYQFRKAWDEIFVPLLNKKDGDD